MVKDIAASKKHLPSTNKVGRMHTRSYAKAVVEGVRKEMEKEEVEKVVVEKEVAEVTDKTHVEVEDCAEAGKKKHQKKKPKKKLKKRC